MNIKDIIIKTELTAMKDRLDKLIEIDAPDLMIANQEKEIKRLEDGVLNIGGVTELLNVEVETSERKIGRGGKVYIQFNGNINYFPNARYGRYISRACAV